jgi:amidohydrolase
MKTILRNFSLALALLTPQIQAATSIPQLVEKITPSVIEWRRDIHQNPELSNREYRTSRVVAEHLRSLGLEVKTNIAKTGVVGILRGSTDGPVIALRADMDALPVTEKTGLPFASTVRGEYEGREVGVMHACGHDAHVAILMGVASVLSQIQSRLNGTVKFIFQPAEEGAPKGEEGGAKLMVDEGVLNDPPVDAIVGLHISQGGPAGTASYRTRGFMASAQRFDVRVEGKQTHGARPWSGIDPIVVSAQIINGLQTIVSRQIDITQHPAVVTVGTISAGVRMNIVPDEAVFSGTIRTFDASVRREIHAKIRSIVENVSESMGAKGFVEIDPGVPVTFNDVDLAESLVPSLESVYGSSNVFQSPRITGAEDFSFFQEEIPGFFFFIGGRPESISPTSAIPNHSPYFSIDERALSPAVHAMSRIALDFLSSSR